MSDHLDLLELLALGESTLVSKALAGELRPRHLWVAIKGAKKYRAAIRCGDLRGQDAADAFVATCDRCKCCTVEASYINGQTVAKMFCGPSFENRLDQPEPTCGCLVGLRVNGELVPGGKAMVASEKCPQGKGPP